MSYDPPPESQVPQQPDWQQPVPAAAFHPAAPIPQPEPASHRKQRTRPRRRRALVLAVGGGVVAVIAVAGIAGAAIGGGKPAADHPAASGGASHPMASSASSATPAAASSAAVASPAQTVMSWWDGGAKSAFGTLTTALTATSKDANNMAALGGACQQISQAVTGMQSVGPVGYRPLEKWLARALAQYSTGAAECTAGANATSASMLAAATTAINKGNYDLGKATAVIGRLGG